MIERQIEEVLKGVVEIEYVLSDGQSVYLKFLTRHLNQALMDLIQDRVSPLGLRAAISSQTTVARQDGTADQVILRLLPHGNGHLQLDQLARRLPRSTRWKWLGHPMVNLGLFLITLVVVFVTGAATIINRTIVDTWNWSIGFQFSFSLLGILTAHEFGHYVAARYHKLDVTLPYFLPGILVPPGLFAGFGGTTIIPGTFGAFIRIKSPIRNKRQLMDVGAAGPIAGFLVCLVILIYGFVTIPEKSYAYQFYDVEDLYKGEPEMFFGSSLLFNFLGTVLAGDRMPAMYDIVHYPLLFAGWFGLLVTALNLLPIGQLDGGHITYALLGKKQKYFAMVTFAMILFMGLILDIRSWLVWALLIILVIRIKHPAVAEENVPLDSRRQLIGILALIIFVLCFIPAPIYEAMVTR